MSQVTRAPSKGTQPPHSQVSYMRPDMQQHNGVHVRMPGVCNCVDYTSGERFDKDKVSCWSLPDMETHANARTWGSEGKNRGALWLDEEAGRHQISSAPSWRSRLKSESSKVADDNLKDQDQPRPLGPVAHDSHASGTAKYIPHSLSVLAVLRISPSMDTLPSVWRSYRRLLPCSIS